MREVRRTARAKVNPFLRVLGRRDDGFHEIETLVVRVPPDDRIVVRPDDEVTLTVTGPLADRAPTGTENLVLRAAHALRERCGTSAGAATELLKRIPVAAGMGGGSADAAAALGALAELWRCGDPATLRTVAAEVGSDVPALLLDDAAVVRGRGELVEPFPVAVGEASWVTVTAPFGISAADAYRWWDEDRSVTGPDPGPLLDALRAGDAAEAGPLLFNDLEPGILRRYPSLARTIELLAGAGAYGAIVCGSGPTVLALVPEGFQAGIVVRAR